MRKLAIAALASLAGCAADPHRAAMEHANDLCTRIGIVTDDPRRTDCLLLAYTQEREHLHASAQLEQQRWPDFSAVSMPLGLMLMQQGYQTRPQVTCTHFGFTTTCN
jgi:hypothetical protein